MIRLSHIAAPAVLTAAMFLGTGCASDEHPKDIPLSAQEIGTGREKVSYTAPYDGTVYVRDDTRKEIVYSGKVSKGQMVNVDAKHNQVLIDNQTATKQDMVNDHKYSIYFDEDRDREHDRDRNARTSSGTMGGTMDANAPRTTVITPGATVQTPGNTTVVTPGSTSAAPAAPAAPAAGTGQTTVTTPNGTVIRER